MHKLLARQLRRFGLSTEAPPSDLEAWRSLLDHLDRSYRANDQGRYLLERSLAISSAEMQQAYRRQAAIAACSRALLYSNDAAAVTTALDTLLDAVDGVCAAVDLNVSDDRGPARFRAWRSCRLGADHPPEVTELWDLDPELHALLEGGRTYVASGPACSAGSDQAATAHVPVPGTSGWLATLLVSTSGGEWSKADLQLLRVGAEMLGIFLEQQSARDELERLSRSKDELIASVSHELRTPLTVVVGLAQELHDRLPEFTADETAELVAMILRQGKDVANIVEDLLVAARSSIGVLTVLPSDVKVHEELHAFASGFAGPRLGELEVDAAPVVAHADPIRLRQILRNLVTNAFRYGGTHVRMESEPTADGARVTVSDDGPGVPDELREAIFEPFTRAHREGSRPAAVGIGLTVSRELARLMGGDLVYRYEAGRSRFELTLPGEVSP